MKKKYYITTAIDYVNAEPHIGHAYQKIIADVLARWHKSKGEQTFYLTGTDEHGKKIADSAKVAGKTTQKFVDGIAVKFKEAWKLLNIQPDRFIRTTDKDHERVVQEFIKKCDKAGDIYKGSYEGLYCVGCERYYTEKDLVDGKCQFHPGKKLEILKEESYFFKLSKYQKFLLELYKKNPEFVLPKTRRNEVISKVKEGISDFSITRTSFKWGIPFPLEKGHIVYVWFDALINYLTGAGKKQEFWPAQLHLLGKDNTWFHCVYWPAMLKSAGYELPESTFNHGFLSFNGKKIGKSLGNAISPVTLVKKYGADSIRYFCCRHFPFSSGNDGDFSEKALVDRYNNELADKLGNLVSRVSALVEKYGVEKFDWKKSKKDVIIRIDENNVNIAKIKIKKNLYHCSVDLRRIVERHIEKYEFDRALNEIFAFIDVCNEYVQSKKPWETKDKKVLYELKESILKIAELLWPFIPESSEKITKQFSAKKIKKGEILFSKIKWQK